MLLGILLSAKEGLANESLNTNHRFRGQRGFKKNYVSGGLSVAAVASEEERYMADVSSVESIRL